jgi:SPP1 gp7 family putative phage head morphogenesis protein
VSKRAPKPAMGAAMSYAKLLRRWLLGFQNQATQVLLEDWDRNPVVFSGQIERADASSFVRRKLAQLEVLLEERFNPQHLAGEIEILASRVNKKGLLEFRRVVGVSLHSEQGIPAAIEQFRTRNVDLIKSLAGKAKDRITDTLDEAERTGLRVEDLRKRLIEDFGVTRSKADLLARDQVLKLNGQLNQTRQQNAGIVEYIWRTSQDERVREFHQDLEGSTQLWASPPIVSKDGRTEHPGGDYSCRCTAEPILTLLED